MKDARQQLLGRNTFILVYTQDAHEVKTTKPFFPFMIPSITSFISATHVVIIVVAVIALIIFLHCKINLFQFNPVKSQPWNNWQKTQLECLLNLLTNKINKLHMWVVLFFSTSSIFVQFIVFNIVCLQILLMNLSELWRVFKSITAHSF